MISPAVAAGRLVMCACLGLALGLFYGFLRPLGQRHRHLADLLFLPVLFAAWVYAGFGICQGDLRPGYWLGLAGGAVLWDQTAGRLLRRVFNGFWQVIFQILGFPRWIMKKFLRKILKKAKNIFASGKKSGTIDKIKKTKGTGRRHGSMDQKTSQAVKQSAGSL